MDEVLIFLLFLAALPLPYIYYSRLRYGVFFGLLWLLFKEWNKLTSSNKLIYIIIALLFNPFSLFYFSKLTWVIFDIASAVYLLKVKKEMKIPLYKI